MWAPIRVHGAGCASLRRMSSSYISWYASPRSGMSTTDNSLEQLAAGAGHAAIRVCQQVGGDNGRGCYFTLAQDPSPRWDSQDEIGVVGRFCGPKPSFDLSQGFRAHIPVELVAIRHDVKSL